MGGKLGKKGFPETDKSKDQKTQGAATELEDTAKENGEPSVVPPEPKVLINDQGSQLPGEDEVRRGISAVNQADVTEDDPMVSVGAKAELPEGHDAAGSEALKASQTSSEADISQPLTSPTEEDAEKTSPTAPGN